MLSRTTSLSRIFAFERVKAINVRVTDAVDLRRYIRVCEIYMCKQVYRYAQIGLGLTAIP